MNGLAQGAASVVDGLEHEASSVMNGLAHDTASVVDGLEQGASCVVVYVCALRIREAISFFLEKKDHIYLTGILREDERKSPTMIWSCAT